MNPLETILALQQVENLYATHQSYGKVIDLEMKEIYTTGAFKEEILSGSLRIMPPWMQKNHFSRLN